MTLSKQPFNFNLPYNQSANYWLAIFLKEKNTTLHTQLLAAGMKTLNTIQHAYAIGIPETWEKKWRQIKELILPYKDTVQVTLLPSEIEPTASELSYSKRSVEMLTQLADSLWLGEAMIADKIVCYMQPVLDKRGKVFGYEAFARIETEGTPIGGNKIIETSKYLNAEYALDRYLHVKAIHSFVESDLQGFLFINFLPGFIHRPEKYLAGLTECIKYYGMPAKQIVLDLTQSDVEQDSVHVKAISEYCRAQQYSLSLDDISSVAMAKKILGVINPNFIKLDIHLVHHANEAEHGKEIIGLVEMAHATGITVLAEGVETDEVYQELLKSGVDFFQGYLFSPPVAITALKKMFG